MSEAHPPNDSALSNQHKRKRTPPPPSTQTVPPPPISNVAPQFSNAAPPSKVSKTGHNSNNTSNSNTNTNNSNNTANTHTHTHTNTHTTHTHNHTNLNTNTHHNTNTQLQINYIARQCIDDLPFITKEDSLLRLVDILSSYNNVLDRHESLASNLGARPLGPILIKRFERCFDASPCVIASHTHARDQDLPQVTWLDVVHFAQAHPSQFTLSTFSEGRRVCQFYYPQKQVRVQISEEDFLFINSGRCQDLIPPLPIWEDEEKEVATCEFVEKALRDLTAAADSVAARTRQLAHRLKGRRMAIQDRRAVQDSQPSQTQSHPQAAFAAVNAQQPQSQPSERPDPSLNIRADLLKHFQSLPPKPPAHADNRRISVFQQQQPNSPSHSHHYQTPPPISQPAPPQPTSSSVSPVPTTVAAVAAAAAAQAAQASQSNQRLPPHYTDALDASRHNFSRPLPPNHQVSQPYRQICHAHMESLPRSSRVLPPCDRCRRLKMDCLKNLSSCTGCTKKHARCHWKDVTRDEVQGLEGFEDADRLAAEYDPRTAVDYETSDTSIDGDATRRQSAEYETVAPPTNQQYQEPPISQRPTYDDPAIHSEPPVSNRPQPFPEDPTPQNHPQIHGMDIMRLLGSDAPREPAFSAATGAPARNNGAFRTMYTPNESMGVPVSNGLNNGVAEGERA